MANFNANVVTTSTIINQTNKRYISALSSSSISSIPTRISIAPFRMRWVADVKKDTGTGGQFQSDEFPTMYSYLN